MLVHEPNCHGAFTDRRGHAFGRASADVADREDAGSAGLQHQRRTRYMTPHLLVTELVGVGAGELNPSASRATVSESHVVCGVAPMKTKSARAGSSRRSPFWLFSTTTASRVLSPTTSRTSVHIITSTRG